ncbi:unnamed protein product [Caretta caretta]
MIVDNLPEDTHSSLVLFCSKTVSHIQDGVKILTQDQALMMIQCAKEGGHLLIEAHLLRPQYQGLSISLFTQTWRQPVMTFATPST